MGGDFIIPYKIITGLVGLTLFVIILRLVRKDRLRVNYSVWWIAVSAAIALFGLFPQIIDVVGRYTGIAYPPVLALVLGLCLILLKILTMDLERTSHERQIRELTQRLAVLEAESGNKKPGRRH